MATADEQFDVTIIGAGPGGYVAAIRAAQLGFKTALIEKSERLGGTCLNIGCIPSKALLDSSERFAEAQHSFARHGIETGGVKLNLSAMMKRKDAVVDQLTSGIGQLVKANGITRFAGSGSIDSADKGRIELTVNSAKPEKILTSNLILATGSEPVELPGLEFDGKQVLSSTEALALDAVPNTLAVIGAGAIGLEMASVWSRLGARVTVIELADQILPGWDPALAKALKKELEKQGITFILGNKVAALKKSKSAASLVLDHAEGEVSSIVADKVLVAVGRKPFTKGLGLERAKITPDERGRIPVDGNWRVKGIAEGLGIYAIGDIIAGPMLAHKAEDEGVAVAEVLAGQAGHVNYGCIPGVVYTWPEAAMVGETEAQLTARGAAFTKGTFAMSINGRAIAADSAVGQVTIYADSRTDRVLGAWILGPGASELIAEVTAFIELKASAEDLARTVHAHPTLSESVKEAALNVAGRSIHGVNRKNR